MIFVKNLFQILLFLFVVNSSAQSYEVNLWEGIIPNSIENSTYNEIQVFEDSVLVKVSQVKTPTLTVFKPQKPNGTTIIICPGGGYAHLAIDKEGYKVAKWLNTLGITAVVLKYRLPSEKIMIDKTIGPLQDAQEAIRYVRKHKKELTIDENKIGIMGFSAGGHLAASLSIYYNFDSEKNAISAKPNFTILIYPVISMDDSITHKGSKKNLLGENPSKELQKRFSVEEQTSESQNPTFLVHSTDDKSVPVENSINYYLALKESKVPVEMHLYEKGGHGFGLGKENTSQFWTKDCENWLKMNKF